MTVLGFLTRSLALSILERDGREAVFNLHTAAAAAYRIGHPAAADAILEIAEAAAEEWMSAASRDRTKRARGL